jgi:hypothetical protein
MQKAKAKIQKKKVHGYYLITIIISYKLFLSSISVCEKKKNKEKKNMCAT